MLTALGAAAISAGIRKLPHNTAPGLCLWAAMAVACAQRTGLLGLALAAGCGLCTAYAGTLAQSAVLAVAMAAAVTAATPALSYAALAVALGTLGAALLAPGERGRCAAVFLAGCAAGALAAPDAAGALRLLGAAGAGGGALPGLPGQMAARGVPAAGPRPPPPKA